MYKFNEFLEESLVDEISSEENVKSSTAKEARKLGLSYVGFGRYADSTGSVAYVVKNDKLIPFRKSEEILNLHQKKIDSQLKGKSGKEYDQLVNQGVEAQEEVGKRSKEYTVTKTKELLKYDRELKKLYDQDLFTPEELNALMEYTEQNFQDINSYLYRGFKDDTPPDVANQIMSEIDTIDSAFEETGAPFDYTVYTGLSDRYDYNKIQPGKDYIFRGYISTSLSYDIATDLFTDSKQEYRTVLELSIREGQKSIYMEGFTNNEGEFETLLPRGTKVQIVSGPHLLDNPQLAGALTKAPVALFKCSIVEE